MTKRLIRKLWLKCRQKKEISAEEKKNIEKELKDFPERIEKPRVEKWQIFEAKGCEVCGETGYKGRIGVYEGFLIDGEIEKLILSEPSEVAIREAAVKQGMLTMRQDGILKLLSGVTTLEELERVVGSWPRASGCLILWVVQGGRNCEERLQSPPNESENQAVLRLYLLIYPETQGQNPAL